MLSVSQESIDGACVFFKGRFLVVLAIGVLRTALGASAVPAFGSFMDFGSCGSLVGFGIFVTAVAAFIDVVGFLTVEALIETFLAAVVVVMVVVVVVVVVVAATASRPRGRPVG